MDLPTILADKALLASLSREYELLKATNASIDWEEWITARLKRAAARRVGNSSSINTTFKQQHAGTAQQLKPAARHANVSLRTPSKTAAHQAASKAGFSNRRTSTADAGLPPAPQAHEQAVDWQAQDVTNTQHTQQAGMPTPSLIQLHSSSAADQAAHGPYAQGFPGQLGPHSGPQPHWVAAARLGTALQASKVVSTMHAAADRERRLAAAAAVARQQLDLGMECALAGAGGEQQLQPAAQEQLQQMVKLTQEVVEQNQLLQQAMRQQQAQLSEQQGMLTTVLQQAGKTSTSENTSVTSGAAPAAQASLAAAAAPQQAATATADVAGAASRSPDKLRDQIKDSWLVKSLLQQTSPSSSNKAGASNPTTAPDFIRIAGASKQPKRLAADQQLKQEQQPMDTVSTAEDAAQDRRKQLKAVLRQLLTRGAVGSLPDGLAGLVEGLKGLQSSSAQQQARAQDSKAGAQAQAASLVALLQQQQQQQQTGLTQLSKAQQLVLQRRKAKEEEKKRQQEQGEQEEDSSKPGWQSEVYVPPPSRMLRVKKGGAADVWNAADSSEPGPARTPVSKSAGSKPQPPRRKPGQKAATGARAKAAGGRRSSGGGSAGGARSLSSVLYGSRWRVDGGVRQQQQQQQQDMAAGYMYGESSRLARVEEATTQVLEAVARLEQRVQQPQRPAPGRSSARDSNYSADSLPLQDPAALASLLSALERVGQQEKEIQERWFGSSSGGGGSSGAQQNLIQAAAAAQHPSQDGSQCRAQANSPGSASAPDQQQAALADHAGEQQLAVVPVQQQDECQLQDAMQQQQQEQACALDAAALKSIKAGRQRFLRHQAMLDGTLHDLGSNGHLGQGSVHTGAGGRGATSSRGSRGVLQPDQVVEAVADLLLEELLLQEAQDLDGFCDALCDQLVEDEFEEA